MWSEIKYNFRLGIHKTYYNFVVSDSINLSMMLFNPEFTKYKRIPVYLIKKNSLNFLNSFLLLFRLKIISTSPSPLPRKKPHGRKTFLTFTEYWIFISIAKSMFSRNFHDFLTVIYRVFFYIYLRFSYHFQK